MSFERSKEKYVRYTKLQFKTVFKNYLHEISSKHLTGISKNYGYTYLKVFPLQKVSIVCCDEKSQSGNTKRFVDVFDRIQPTATIDFAISLVPLAAHNVADMYLVNNSFVTSTFSVLTVHKPLIRL